MSLFDKNICLVPFKRVREKQSVPMVGEMAVANLYLLKMKKICSDLDRVTRNTMKAIFTNAKQLWCTQHMQAADVQELKKLRLKWIEK